MKMKLRRFEVWKERNTSNPKPIPGENREKIKFSTGVCNEEACKIIVDGAWKKDVRKECPSTGISWTARRGQEVIFKGNERVKANSML